MALSGCPARDETDLPAPEPTEVSPTPAIEEGEAEGEEAPVESDRPPSIPPPSEEQPIAIWSETAEPVVNLRGDVRLGYEKLAGLDRRSVTVELRAFVEDASGERSMVPTLHFRREVIERAGEIRLGSLLAAVDEKGSISRQLSGEGVLAISVGKGGRGVRTPYEPLSNEVTIPCKFEQTSAASESG